MIVEDDPVISDAVARGLRADGFVVTVTGDGEQGLVEATEGVFDVIVLDIMLPMMSGYEVCRRLRAAGSPTPILMLTAKDTEHDEANALDLGADDYLTKPFSFVVLRARLRALLRRVPAEHSTTVAVGNLVLDSETFRCSRGGKQIVLTAREFALLEFLMRNQGRIVSKGMIAEYVWDAELDIDSNVVEVYIGYLRRKIDKPFQREDIETIRGVGYRFASERLARR
nr:response regulator transcription factor [Frigoribacterium sp. CG_9.8]